MLGWGVPVVAWTACFDSRPVPLNSSGWSDTSHLGLNTATMALVLGPAFLPLLWAPGWPHHMTIMGAIGITSAAAAPLWWRLLKRTWQRRRHPMLAAFRESQS
jgi:hypothetical protein